MAIVDQIQQDVKDAMRARDSDRVTALRMLVAALQSEAKAKRLDELPEAEEIAVLTRERKRRVEAATAFEDGGAPERAVVEREQMEMIDAYLPEQLSEDEVHKLVAEAIAETGATTPKEMGAVMKALMPKIQGRADGKVVSGAVNKALAGGS
jgi:uncharacterized protein YqeY